MRWRRRWEWGDRRRLAIHVGISPTYLCDIMAGRKTCPPELAVKLEREACLMGYKISRMEWVFREDRKRHPLFPPYSR